MNYTLEAYEWDSTWTEKTGDKATKRILYIGDSISCGTRPLLNSLSRGRLLFDGFGTSRGLDNPFFFKLLSVFAADKPRPNAVLFNNGLHERHLKAAEYARLYSDFLSSLEAEFSGARIIPILTTFVTNPEYNNAMVTERNDVVRKIAAEKKLDAIDLYSVSEANREMLTDDGVHFTEAGYKKLAEAIISFFGD